MNAQYATRVVIADSQEIFTTGLKSLLTGVAWIVVVGEANEATGLFEILESSRVDLLLLDPGLPEVREPHLIERLRILTGNLRIVVMTAGDESEKLRTALQLGADGIIHRSAGAEEFVSAVRKVADGHHYIQPELINSLVWLSAPPMERVSERLSPRQSRVLQLLTQGLGNRQIAATMDISETTVKSELRLIYAELEASSRAEAAAIALRIGLVD